jgi:hypothetical protein
MLLVLINEIKFIKNKNFYDNKKRGLITAPDYFTDSISA